MSWANLTKEQRQRHRMFVAARLCSACVDDETAADALPCLGCDRETKPHFRDKYAQAPAPAAAETVSVQVPKAPDGWKYTGEIVTVVEPNSDNPYMLVRLYVTRPVRPFTNGELLVWAAKHNLHFYAATDGRYWCTCDKAEGMRLASTMYSCPQDALRALIAAYEKERSKT